MVGITEITAGLGSLKAAKDIVQGLNAAATEVTVNDVKIQLQGFILEAQQGLFAAQQNEAALAARINELEQETMRLKDWSAEREKYELKPIDTGSFAYMPKTGMDDSQPPHWLCTECFENGHKSILQFQKQYNNAGSGGAKSDYKCNKCKATLAVFYRRHPDRPYPLQDAS